MNNLKDYDYVLPKKLIAQQPIKKRDESNFLIYLKNQDKIIDKKFKDLLNYIQEGDVICINESKVFKSKIQGKKQTGSKCILTLLEKIKKNKRYYKCLIKTKKPKENDKLFFKNFSAKIIKVKDFDFLIKVDKNLNDSDFEYAIPPYIKEKPKNQEQYQTIYSKSEKSIASPTAGLHFTNELIKKIKEKKAKFAKINLHVGIGTFSKIKNKDIRKHKMHEEFFEIDKKNAKIINSRKNRLIVIGTTTLRALESSSKNNIVYPKKDFTNIYIKPGYIFNLKYDIFITNFHLPKTSLLVLLSAFESKWKKIYLHAINKKYRFFSFGDSMCIFF